MSNLLIWQTYIKTVFLRHSHELKQRGMAHSAGTMLEKVWEKNFRKIFCFSKNFQVPKKKLRPKTHYLELFLHPLQCSLRSKDSRKKNFALKNYTSHTVRHLECLKKIFKIFSGFSYVEKPLLVPCLSERKAVFRTPKTAVIDVFVSIEYVKNDTQRRFKH